MSLGGLSRSGRWRPVTPVEADGELSPAVLHVPTGRGAWGRHHAMAYEKLGFNLVDDDRYATIDDIPDGELVSGWVTSDDKFYDGAGSIWAGHVRWVTR